MDPTKAGFVDFLRAMVGISTLVLPDNSTYISLVYNYAMNVADTNFQRLPNADPSQPSLYALLVYNLATHTLIELAQDVDPSTYFRDARAKFGLNNAFGGVVTSASDEGTSASAMLPDWIRNMSLREFQMIKTPWGRFYMNLAQQGFPPWGIT